MYQIAAKTYLGIALDDAIKDMKLQKQAKKIYDTFYQVFDKHYAVFKNNYHQSSKTQGVLYEHFQYPIGDRQALQYYLAYGEMAHTISNFRNVPYLKNVNPSMLQGFSTNEGAKMKPNKRARKGCQKAEGQSGRKSRNI